MKKRCSFFAVFSIAFVISSLVSTGLYAERKGTMTTTVSFGGYQATDGSDTITGSQLALGVVTYFTENWAWFARLGSESAQGQHTENGETAEISAGSTTLSGGVQFSLTLKMGDDGESKFVPYAGAGLSVQKYHYDFSYEGSETGNTSGTGYGPLFMIGLNINFSDRFILIPGYHFNQIYIKTEEGENKTITSSGTSIAFVAMF